MPIPQAVPDRVTATPMPPIAWWRRAWHSVRTSVPKQLALLAVVLGGLATAGHFVGGFVGWWHLYEVAFLKKHEESHAPGKAPRLSLVVLPLAGEADAPDAGALGEALTTDLTTELGQLTGSFVISRDTASRYKGKAVDPREVARELNVRYVVRGTVRRTENDVRLHLALVDGRSGAQKWAEQFRFERANLAAGVEDVSRMLSRSLGVELVRAEGQRAATLQPAQVEADDLAMQGWSVWYRGLSPENVLEALRIFESAVAKDPNSLRAWSGISLTTGAALSSGWAPDAATFIARQKEARANMDRIDPNDVLAYMGRVGPYWWGGDFEGLLQLATTIVEKFPNNPYGHQYKGSSLLMLGRFEECVAPLKTAIRLGPRDTALPYWHATLAYCHLFAGRHGDAVHEARQAIQANTGLAGPHLILAGALALDGRRDEALELVRANKDRRNFHTKTMRLVLVGKEPRFVEQRERLIATLNELGVP